MDVSILIISSSHITDLFYSLNNAIISSSKIFKGSFSVFYRSWKGLTLFVCLSGHLYFDRDTHLHITIGIIRGFWGGNHSSGSPVCALVHGIFWIVAVGSFCVSARVIDSRQHFPVSASPQCSERHTHGNWTRTLTRQASTATTFAFAQAETRRDNFIITYIVYLNKQCGRTFLFSTLGSCIKDMVCIFLSCFHRRAM